MADTKPTVAAAGASTGLKLATLTQQANDQTIAQVKKDHPSQIRGVISTADGGTVRGTIATQWRQLEIAGYGGWRRSVGFEAGVEVVRRLGPK